MTNDND